MRIPLSFSIAEFDNQSSLELLLPVSAGVRDLLDENGAIALPNQLMTASLLPGLAWNYQAASNWQIAPSLQAGVAQDFQNESTAWMYTSGVRSYAWWDWGKHRLGFGSRLLAAGQHIESSDSQQGFVLFENGVDWNYPLPWTMAKQPLSASIFVLWQHFFDNMNIAGISGESVALENLYQLGFTFGFRETLTVWGFLPVTRIGFSLIRGNSVGGSELKALSLNLGFPLSYY